MSSSLLILATAPTSGNPTFGYDGKLVWVSVNLRTAGTFAGNTTQFSVTVSDLSSNSPSSVFSYTLSDLLNLLDPKAQQPANLYINEAKTILTAKCVIFNSSTLAQVILTENYTDSAGVSQELTSFAAQIPIKNAPGKPTLSVTTAPTFTAAAASADGVNFLTAGSIKITVPSGQGISNVKMFVKGVSTASKPNFFNYLCQLASANPVAFGNNVTSTFSLDNTCLKAADVNIVSEHLYIYAQAENSVGEGLFSEMLQFSTSIRPGTPSISAAVSMENLQVTVVGQVPLPAANNTYNYSILAQQASAFNSNTPLNGWLLTNIVNKELTSNTSSTFKEIVTLVAGAALSANNPYLFCAIAHKAALSGNAQIPLVGTDTTNLRTQSLASNTASAIPTVLPNADVNFDVSAQSYSSSTGKLTFAPVITGTALPTSASTGLIATFTFQQNNLAARSQTNSSANYVTPLAAFYTATPVSSNDSYKLGFNLDILIPPSNMQYVTSVGIASPPVIGSYNMYYFNALSLLKTVNQNPLPSEVPVPSELTLQNVLVSGASTLIASHVSALPALYAAKNLKLVSYSYRVIRGVVGSPDLAFADTVCERVSASGDKVLFSPATPSGDIPDQKLLTLYGNDGSPSTANAGVWSVQVLANCTVLTGPGAGAAVSALPIYTSAEIIAPLMSAPLAVSGSYYNPSQVKVVVNTPASADYSAGAPIDWIGAKPYSAKCQMVDGLGQNVGPQQEYVFNTADKTTADALAQNTGSMKANFTMPTAMAPGSVLFTKVYIVYVRLNASGAPMADKKAGSLNSYGLAEINALPVIGAVTVTAKTSPVAAEGAPKNINPNANTITMTIQAELNGIAHANVSPSILNFPFLTSVGARLTEYDFVVGDWNADKKQWNHTFIVAANCDYATQQIVVLLQSADAQNIVVKLF